jgi:hypothetical protein
LHSEIRDKTTFLEIDLLTGQPGFHSRKGELWDIFSSPPRPDYIMRNFINIIRDIKLMRTGPVTSTEEMSNAYNILVGKLEGKRSRPRRRWEDNIIMNLRQIGWEGVDWIQRALVNTVMKLGLP